MLSLSPLFNPMNATRRKIGSSMSNGKDKGRSIGQTGAVVAILLSVATFAVYLLTLRSISIAPASSSKSNDAHTLLRKQIQQQQPDIDTKETLVLMTGQGHIRIVLRPDLSPESVSYIRQVVATDSCQPCNLYRAEKPGILQGILSSKSTPVATNKGSCPHGYEGVPNNCPAWDKECGCHGPVMTRGMVAWAAGQTGPDFFMDGYKRAANWWGTQHTVWGEIQDDTSFQVLDSIFDLPARQQGGLTYLQSPIHIDLRIEKDKSLPI